MSQVYDFIGVGLGPFNLSLACLAEPVEELNALFFEQNEKFDWHPGMMLDGVSLQTPFMSDLVTLADPTSKLSFLNYAKQKGNLYSFYIKESFFLLREEYNQYCQWASEQVSSIRFSSRVDKVQFDKVADVYKVDVIDLINNKRTQYLAKKLVLGTGPSPYIPEAVGEHKNVIHSGQFMHKKSQLQSSKSITVVGSGQSAAEIFYELLQEAPDHQYQLNWVTRASRFFPLEYTKLTLEMTSPEYVDYFHGLPQSKRDELISKQKNLYKGINACLINDIYDLLYQHKVKGFKFANLRTNSALEDCELPDKVDRFISLTFKQIEQRKTFKVETEALVMATGFTYRLPDFLESIVKRINWDEQGRFAVDRYYSIDKEKRIFVQNAELHTHGFVTPDLGMACYRNSHIINQIVGREVYKTESNISFQEFAGVDIKASDVQDIRITEQSEM